MGRDNDDKRDVDESFDIVDEMVSSELDINAQGSEDVRKHDIADSKEFWDALYGSLLYRGCISRQKFINLRRYLRFDGMATRSVRRSKGKFPPIRGLWDMINNNSKKHYIPGANLTIRHLCTFENEELQSNVAAVVTKKFVTSIPKSLLFAIIVLKIKK